MLNKLVKIIGIFVLIVSLLGMGSLAFAQDGDPGPPDEATFKSRCEQIKEDHDAKSGNYYLFPYCATSPAECGSEKIEDDEGVPHYNTPLNCLFLEEPIGGDPGYDLYKVECFPTPTNESKTSCETTLWHGEALTAPSEPGRSIRGPIQAILTFEEDKDYQGPFGLLYNYIGLIYKYMSGVIVGFVILMSIIGGIRMTTSGGSPEAFTAGRKMITKALTGMVLWFLASLILYTINPTFFAF